MAQQSIPSNIGTGLVTGRFIVGVADSTDPDAEPDGIPARGRIVFTPTPPYLPAPGSSDGSLTVLQVPITAVLDAQGIMCAPDLLNPGEAGDPGLRLIAADTPTILVNGWTYKVEYFFEMVNNVIPKIPTHEIEVLTGAVIDLTSVVKVPESPGIGEDQAAVLIAMAQAAADRAEIAAAAAAVAAQEAADAAQGAADATASPTPSTIALRDTDGALTGTQLISSETVPTLPEHVTRKDYVDAGVASRAPLVHRHTYGDIDGQVPTSALPPLAVIDTFTAATQTAMLALTAQRGDMCIRTDSARTYVLTADTPTVLSAWKEVMAAGQVTSVNGKAGTVSLSKADIGLSNVDNTSDIGKPLSTASQTALSGKSDVGHTHDVTAIIGLTGADLPGGYDTGWIAVPSLPAGQAHPDLPVQIRRVGVAVRLRGSIRNITSSGTFEAWAQIPTGKAFFPPGQVEYTIASGATAGQFAARVTTAGTINVWSSAVTSSWRALDGLSWFAT